MNGQLLSDLCNLHFILESRFRGVFSANNLPNHVDYYPSAYIVNTADTHSPGEHWISLYSLSFDQCYVFDSFGRDGRLLPPSIHNFILRNCFACTYNSIQTQGAVSHVDFTLYSFYYLCVEFVFFPNFNNSLVVIHIIMIVLFIVFFKPCTLLEMIPHKISMNKIFIFVQYNDTYRMLKRGKYTVTLRVSKH